MCLSCRVTAPHGDRYVNGLRLLRLVRLRREFRALWQLSLLAVPVWIVAVVWVQAATPNGSTVWNLADSWATPGLIVLAGLVVVGLLGMVVVRFVGTAGRMASAFVPVVRRGREATVKGNADALSGLLPRLRRQQWVPLGLVLLFLVFAGMGVAVAMNLGPAYEANHGRGGTIVTVGKDASPAGYSSGSRSRTYYLSTPDGRLVAEDGQPENGQQWVIYNNPAGNDEAYLVGGHEYVLLAALLVFAAVADAAMIVVMAASVRKERRLRAAGGHQPLAYSVRRLAGGARPVLRFDAVRSVVVGLPPLVSDTDEAAVALVRRRRVISSGIGVLVVAIVVGGGFVVRAVTAPPPPTTKEITLGYLGSGLWSPDVEVFYADNGVHDVTVDMLQDGGVAGTPVVAPVWSVVVTSPGGVDGNVDVAGIGSVSGSQAVAGGVAFEKEVAETGSPAPVAITGLPAGWTGVLTDGKAGGTDRTASVFGSGGGTLVEISVSGSADADLANRSRALAVAIARRGISGFAGDTAR